eukprot:179150-Pleurochrysis_carterae.AAC.2
MQHDTRIALVFKTGCKSPCPGTRVPESSKLAGACSACAVSTVFIFISIGHAIAHPRCSSRSADKHGRAAERPTADL